jgi:Na+-transporting methylmalonyl-CoA/oxaloacetate decarboxylase gamma subunit
LDESLQIALTITVIGMTLLFLSLILFWGLITLLTAVVKDKPASPAQQVAAEESGKAREGTGAEARARHRAAAVAVVLARAQAEGRSSPAVAPVAAGTPADRRVSAWWSLHHQRRLGPNPEPKRNR